MRLGVQPMKEKINRHREGKRPKGLISFQNTDSKLQMNLKRSKLAC